MSLVFRLQIYNIFLFCQVNGAKYLTKCIVTCETIDKMAAIIIDFRILSQPKYQRHIGFGGIKAFTIKGCGDFAPQLI